jgi:hypothetical protein
MLGVISCSKGHRMKTLKKLSADVRLNAFEFEQEQQQQQQQPLVARIQGTNV